MSIETNGEPSRARTCDPLIKSQLLYQLSYRPTAEVKIILLLTPESSSLLGKTNLECGDLSPLWKAATCRGDLSENRSLAATSRRLPKR